MGQRHGGVARQEHHGHRTPDHEAATEHHDALARNGDAVEIERFQTRLGRSGREALARVGEHAGERRRSNAVDILDRSQAVAHSAFIHGSGQRAEHETAVDARIGIHEVDDGLQLGLRRLRWQHETTHGDAVEIGLGGRRSLVGQIVGRSPTRTMASVGATPCARKRSMRGSRRSHRAEDTSLPYRILAIS